MKFTEMKQEMENIDQGGSRNPDVIYFQDNETTYIRLVPMNDIPDELNKADQFVQAWVHYRSGGVVPNTSFSPRTFGKKDPVEEFVDLELRERVSKQKFKYLMNMKPSKVYITTAIVRGKEEEGTKLLVLTEGKFKDLGKAIEMAFKPEPVEDITDPHKGFDITVQVTGKDESDTNFRKFDWNVNVRKSKPLASDEDAIQNLLDNQPDWQDAYNKLEPTELDKYLESSFELGDGDSELPDSDDKDVTDYEPSDESEEEIIADAEKNFEEMVGQMEETPEDDQEDTEKREPVPAGDVDSDGEDDDMPF